MIRINHRVIQTNLSPLQDDPESYNCINMTFNAFMQ